MRHDLWPSDDNSRQSSEEQRRARLIAAVIYLSRCIRESHGRPMLTEFLKTTFAEERPSFVALVKEFLTTQKEMTEFLRAAYEHERPALMLLVKDFAVSVKKGLAPPDGARPPLAERQTPGAVVLETPLPPSVPTYADAPEWVRRLPSRSSRAS